MTPRTRERAAVHPAGVLLALAAAAWHAILVSKATNDNFFHLTLAKQMLAGEWPVRDFFDHGWVLHYALSALAQAALGDELLSEALIVGTMWAVSTYLVFRLARALTGSTTAAVLAAVLLIVAGPRGYAYPKGVIYAVAATLWWRYVEKPTTGSAAAFGAWAAVAFYWRPDHGVYVAAGLVLAVFAAHGFRPVALARCAAAGATAVALAAPFLLYVQRTVGLAEYVETGAVHWKAEHTTHGTHDWPLLRYSSELFEIEPAVAYGPFMTIAWTESSSPEARQEVMRRYGLRHMWSEDAVLDRVRLSEHSLANLRQLLNEPIVQDTEGVDRASATVPPGRWPEWQQRVFRHWWLRVRVLPKLTPQARASEILVVLFYTLPLVVVVAGAWLDRYLREPATPRRLAWFALFAIVVNLGLLRTPYAARAVDAIVLPAILFGCCAAAFWRAGPATVIRRGVVRMAFTVFAALVVVTVSEAAEFSERVTWLAGGWTSAPAARSAWSEVHGQLTASPPLSYYVDRPANSSLRLAAYVRECVPPSERLLVLWFAPEIYYYADRLMAQRHLVFVPAWSELEHEQRPALARITRFAPPIALARRSALDAQARATYPEVVVYVEREYGLAGTIEEEGEEYLIFARRDRTPLRAFGPQRWPCYVRERSIWSRVGGAAK